MRLSLLKLGIMALGLFVFSQSAISQTDKRGKQRPNDEKRFAELDTNKDRYIDLKEFKAQKHVRKEKAGKKDRKDDKVKKGIKEKKRMSLEEIFNKKDTNSDRRLDIKEFKAKLKKDKKGKKTRR